jgi:hypothetical protein
MSDHWEYDETFIVVLQNMETKKFTLLPTVKNDEGYVLTILSNLSPRQRLRNLFKVTYKGETIPFEQLAISPKLRSKIRELTGK